MKNSEIKKPASGDQAGTLSRRNFLKACAAGPVVAAGARPLVGERTEANPVTPDPRGGLQAKTSGAQGAEKFVAIQVGAVSFVDEGIDKGLEILQERGGVNTLMLAVV